MKCNSILLLLLFTAVGCYAQNSYEREHRIKKSQFPKLQQEFLTSVDGIKQPRYYKEVSNSEIAYILKFKKDRLYYYMNFNPEGHLQNMGFKIKEVDIPSDTFSNVQTYFSANFDKVKIRRMYQEYSVPDLEESEQTIKNAFQNMLLPGNIYKLILVAIKERKRVEYEAYFDAEGNFVKMRQSLPANYDHILY